MSNNKIDFETHSKLSDKFGLKLAISLVWREILLLLLPAAAIGISPLFLFKDLGPDQQLILAVALGLVAYILSILLTNQYIINSLTRIKFKHFRVHLVKDDLILSRMGFYDCLRWQGSYIWRQLALSILYAIIAMGIEHFQFISESVMTRIDRSVSIVVLGVAFVWVLKTKKTGSLIIIQPPQKN